MISTATDLLTSDLIDLDLGTMPAGAAIRQLAALLDRNPSVLDFGAFRDAVLL